MKKVLLFALVFICLSICYLYKDSLKVVLTNNGESNAEHTLVVPSDRFPETAAHIKRAIEQGASPACTIDRKGADENRKESLKGIPTKKGYDRDEFPMAMCAEGGAGANIQYVTPADNRGAGSWIANQLEKFADGTKVLVVVK